MKRVSGQPRPSRQEAGEAAERDRIIADHEEGPAAMTPLADVGRAALHARSGGQAMRRLAPQPGHSQRQLPGMLVVRKRMPRRTLRTCPDWSEATRVSGQIDSRTGRRTERVAVGKVRFGGSKADTGSAPKLAVPTSGLSLPQLPVWAGSVCGQGEQSYAPVISRAPR